MKKGCFIQAVVIVTILIAAIIYVIQYKLEDWFIKPSKKFLISEAVRTWIMRLVIFRNLFRRILSNH